jgi:hypothetical protein
MYLLCIHTYVCVYGSIGMYVFCIYTYMYVLDLYVCMCFVFRRVCACPGQYVVRSMCMYVYVNTHIHTYILTYILTDLQRPSKYVVYQCIMYIHVYAC